MSAVDSFTRNIASFLENNIFKTVSENLTARGTPVTVAELMAMVSAPVQQNISSSSSSGSSSALPSIKPTKSAASSTYIENKTCARKFKRGASKDLYCGKNTNGALYCIACSKTTKTVQPTEVGSLGFAPEFQNDVPSVEFEPLDKDGKPQYTYFYDVSSNIVFEHIGSRKYNISGLFDPKTGKMFAINDTKVAETATKIKNCLNNGSILTGFHDDQKKDEPVITSTDIPQLMTITPKSNEVVKDVPTEITQVAVPSQPVSDSENGNEKKVKKPRSVKKNKEDGKKDVEITKSIIPTMIIPNVPSLNITKHDPLNPDLINHLQSTIST